MKNFTLIVLGFLLGAVTIAACSKSATTNVPHVPVASVQPASSTDAQTADMAAKASAAADAAQHAQAKALTETKAPVLAPRPVQARAKAAVRGSTSADAEKAAYAKAAFNAWRANCLSVLVDMKISSDQVDGEISEWGSVLGAGVCNTQF